MFTAIVTWKNGSVEYYDHFDSYDRARNFADEMIAENNVMRVNLEAE